MNNNVTYEDLCNMIANNCEHNTATPHSADIYLRAIYKTILRQLELNQKVHFKGFGTFEVKERKSGERLINNPKNNKMELVYVEPRLSISFKPSSKFSYSVNENNFKYMSDKRAKSLDAKNNRRYEHKKFGTIADLLNRANRRKV